MATVGYIILESAEEIERFLDVCKNRKLDKYLKGRAINSYISNKTSRYLISIEKVLLNEEIYYLSRANDHLINDVIEKENIDIKTIKTFEDFLMM